MNSRPRRRGGGCRRGGGQSIVSASGRSLPVKLQAELNLARGARGQNLAERVRWSIARGQADGAGIVEAVRLRIRGPLRVVEGVDRVGAELHPLRAD